MSILLLLDTLGFLFPPEFFCFTSFKPVTVKNPHFSTSLHWRAVESRSMIQLYTGQGFISENFTEMKNIFSRQTLCSSGSELAGCYGENINFTLAWRGKPAEWPLESDYPASIKGFGRPKEGRRFGVCSQHKQMQIHTHLFLQPKDPDALRARIAFLNPLFSL